MAKLPPAPGPRRVPFFQREDWLISAGLVLVIYIVILITLHYFAPGASSFVRILAHLLLPMAAAMAWKGIRERDATLARLRESRAKRRRVEHELAKINPPSTAPADKEKSK